VLDDAAPGREPERSAGPQLNGLTAALHRGTFALGSWIQVGDHEEARRVGDSSADFVILDMEHLGFSFPELEQTLQWLLSRRNAAQRPTVATPIVRIPSTGAEFSSWMAKQVLDHGAFGLLVPHVTAPDHIAAAARSMRYPAAAGSSDGGGVRGALPARAMRYWGVADIGEYFARADLWPAASDGELALTVLAESHDAWDAIDDLVRAPGLSAVLWGPGDGALSLGLRDWDIDHPQLRPHREKVVAAARAAGVAVGAAGAADPFAAIDEGFDFMAMPAWDEDLARRLRAHAAAR
jgi:4-hydroxy-2-oxoheptanedioate aldolase